MIILFSDWLVGRKIKRKEVFTLSKTAIVTGAASGIGAAIAKRLAKDGYNVAINCSSEKSASERGAAVAEKCREYGVEAECFVADVSSFEACDKMVKEVKARFGSVDVLVNNAGITKDGLLARMSEEQFDTVIAVNLKSVFNMTRAVTPIMMKQRSGRMINISSVAGLYGNAGQVNYSASKAGIMGITMSAAKELGARNITVNAIAPGFVQTPMTDVLPDNVKESILGATALKRFAKPEEIAGAASFLASDDAAFITGQVIVVDGGLSM